MLGIEFVSSFQNLYDSPLLLFLILSITLMKTKVTIEVKFRLLFYLSFNIHFEATISSIIVQDILKLM